VLNVASRPLLVNCGAHCCPAAAPCRHFALADDALQRDASLVTLLHGVLTQHLKWLLTLTIRGRPATALRDVGHRLQVRVVEQQVCELALVLRVRPLPVALVLREPLVRQVRVALAHAEECEEHSQLPAGGAERDLQTLWPKSVFVKHVDSPKVTAVYFMDVRLVQEVFPFHHLSPRELGPIAPPWSPRGCGPCRMH
jgi:hypothetical protein